MQNSPIKSSLTHSRQNLDRWWPLSHVAIGRLTEHWSRHIRCPMQKKIFEKSHWYEPIDARPNRDVQNSPFKSSLTHSRQNLDRWWPFSHVAIGRLTEHWSRHIRCPMQKKIFEKSHWYEPIDARPNRDVQNSPFKSNLTHSRQNLDRWWPFSHFAIGRLTEQVEDQPNQKTREGDLICWDLYYRRCTLFAWHTGSMPERPETVCWIQRSQHITKRTW